MKKEKNRKLSIVSLILTLMLILPLGLSVPSVHAEGLAAWDAVSYQDLPDADADLVNKYLSSTVEQGVAMDANFNIDVKIEMGDAEQRKEEPVVMNGGMQLALNQNNNATVKMNMVMNMMGEANEMISDIYIVDDPADPTKLAIYTSVSDGTVGEDGQPVIDFSAETIDRAQVEEFATAGVSVEDFNQVATLKIREDKGDTVDAVMLVSFTKLSELANQSMEGQDIDLPIGEVDETLAQFEQFQAELGITEFVMPINVTLVKETGQIQSLSIDGSPLQEILTKIFDQMMSSDPEMPSMNITLNAFSVNVDNIRYGVTDEITVPQEILTAIAALQQGTDTGVTEPVGVGGESEATDTTETTVAGETTVASETTAAGEPFAFTAPLIYDDSSWELVDPDAAKALFADLAPTFTFAEIDPEDGAPSILVTFTNTTPYPIESYIASGKATSSNEGLSYYFANSVIMPGESAPFDVSRGYSEYQRLESPEDFELAELSINFIDAPNHTTYITYDAKLDQITYSSGSDYDEYVTESIVDPEAFTLELGLNDYGSVDYVIYNNSELAITSFHMIYKTHDGYALIISNYDTLLPGDSSATSSTYSDSPELDLTQLEPQALEVNVNVEGEETTITYEYGLDMFLIN